jgi:RraA family protein
VTDPVIDALSRHPTATIADAQDRFGVPSGIAPMWPAARLAGRAFTVETRPGDNLYVHRALAEAPPGAVLVINGFGDLTRALIGDLIVTTAVAKGFAGFVIDGVIRDIDTLPALGMPIFARGVCPAGPYKTGPGRLDVPVAIGGVVVTPGDAIIGDADGIVVIRRADCEHVLERTETLLATEHTKRHNNSQAARNRLK